jgi:hypothetical protein
MLYKLIKQVRFEILELAAIHVFVVVLFFSHYDYSSLFIKWNTASPTHHLIQLNLGVLLVAFH